MGITPEQARKLCQQAGAPLPPGMHAGNFEYVRGTKRKMVGNLSFRSTLEASVYILLKSWEDMGQIRNLVRQPKYVLQNKARDRNGKAIREIVYTPDFEFERNRFASEPWKALLPHDWITVVIEAKGFRTEAYRIRARLFQVKYPDIVFQEWTRETLKANGG